jgi:hypothetical protein
LSIILRILKTGESSLSKRWVHIDTVQPWTDKVFLQLDVHVELMSRKITYRPVYLGLVERIPHDGAAAMARMHGKDGVSYEVLMTRSYFRKNRRDVKKLKKIIGHELAHIRYENHGVLWRREARHLGAGEYATEYGTLKKGTRRKY